MRRPAPRSHDGSSASKKKRKGGWILNVAVITVAAGLIATMALPAYAFNPNGTDSAAFGPRAVDGMKKAQSQTRRGRRRRRRRRQPRCRVRDHRGAARRVRRPPSSCGRR